jgi:hypothetical protein
VAIVSRNIAGLLAGRVVSSAFKRSLMHTAWDVKRLTETMTSVLSYNERRARAVACLLAVIVPEAPHARKD